MTDYGADRAVIHSRIRIRIEERRLQDSRWKRGVTLLDAQVGEGVGELYVAKYFPADRKAKMDALVANLRTAMGERLKTLSWMDEKTRAEAQKKLSTFDPRIGYPSKWRDYSALKIQPLKIFENVRSARQFEWKRQVKRLNERVDRTEWGMNPQTVNAYYDPLMNQITFPADRAAYKEYVTKIFELIGDAKAAASADELIALETKLAKVHWAPERQRDVKATNNPVDRAGLKKMIPAIDWDAMLPVAGLGDVQHFVVNETTALRDGARLLDTQAVDTWKKYLAFHLASDYAAELPKAFDEASFNFYSKTIRGIEAQRDRTPGRKSK